MLNELQPELGEDQKKTKKKNHTCEPETVRYH